MGTAPSANRDRLGGLRLPAFQGGGLPLPAFQRPRWLGGVRESDTDLSKGVRWLAYQALRRFGRGELMRDHVVVFMAGLPGAGKSTLIDRRYKLSTKLQGSANRTTVLDLDAEMALHPRFNPDDPDALYVEKGAKPYQWADARIEARFQTAIAQKALRRIVLDGTGTNAPRQVRRALDAQRAGWFVKVLYVSIPLDTAVRRAGRRSRPVAPAKIYHYQAKIAEALVVMLDIADEFETYDAPSNDPPHLLMREGYTQKSRTLIAAEEEARQALAHLAQAKERSQRRSADIAVDAKPKALNAQVEDEAGRWRPRRPLSLAYTSTLGSE